MLKCVYSPLLILCIDVELEERFVGMSVNGKDFQDYIIDTKDESASFIVKSIVTNLFDCKLTKGQRAKLKSRKVIREVQQHNE